MRFSRLMILMFLICAVAFGCGQPHLKTKGRIVKGGATFAPTDGEILRVVFVPMLKQGTAADLYAAEFTDPNGGFQVAGKDLRGMPPGTYRAAIEYRGKRPFFKGKLDSENSPYVFEVDASTKEIVIDLDQPPAKK